MISGQMAAARGRPAGFDYMRVSLAFAIIALHTVLVSSGVEAVLSLLHGPTRPIWALLLPMFFSLSGFLVSGSLERSPTLISFLGLRLLRLLPALAVESLLCMLVIGPSYTDLALKQYLTNPAFRSYGLNLVGYVHFFLPGVFATNPVGWVNAQLWTLKYELYCYAVMAAMAVFGVYKRVSWFIAFCVLAHGLTIVKYRYFVPTDIGIVPGLTLVPSFLYGSLLYRVRARLPWSRTWFFTSLVLACLCLNFTATSTLAALPISYVTVYLGLLNPRRTALVSSGDYSYGIYLYGFPIQQAIAAQFPSFRFWWINLLLAVPIAYLTAYASWHLVEKKGLLLRPRLARLEAAIIGRSWFGVAHGGTAPVGLLSRWVPKRVRTTMPAKGKPAP